MAIVRNPYIAIIHNAGQSQARPCIYRSAVTAGRRMGTFAPGERIIIYDAQTLRPLNMAMMVTTTT